MARLDQLLIDLAAGRRPASPPPDRAAEIVRSATEHRMTGLLWSSVVTDEVVLPTAESALLAARDLAVQQHHARLWRTIHDVQRRLSGIGLETAVMKGVPAEARWYRRMGERPCKDIDLLLRPGTESRLGEILDEIHPDHPQRADLVELVRGGMLQSVDLVVNGIGIDLHADLLKIEVVTRSRDEIWARTELLDVPDGPAVRVLDAEVSLILFAMHLNKDRFARLLGYADLARILADDSLDWTFIDALLRREGIRVHAYSTIDTVTTTLGLARSPVRLPSGRRAGLWARLWPREKSLAGYVGLGTQQHRQLWIPWLAEGRVREALSWWIRRRAFPPGRLLRLYDPDLRGPYPAQWVTGRYRAWRRRRQMERTARSATSMRPGSMQGPTPLDTGR